MRFGTDGTLYCTSFKSTCRQARNLIPDGTFGQLSGVWSTSNATIEGSDEPGFGYRTWRRCKLSSTSGTSMVSCKATFTPEAGHLYYGSCFYMTEDASSEGQPISGDTRWELFYDDSKDDNGTSLGTYVFGTKNVGTGGKWKLLSGICSLNTVPANDADNGKIWVFRNFTNGSNTELYVCKHLVVDLTDTFGAGNEPTKEWCDSSIRELNSFANFGCSWDASGSGADNYAGSQISAGVWYEWGRLNSNWEPVEYMYHIRGHSSHYEGYLTSKFSRELDNSCTYYVSYDGMLSNWTGNEALDVYWPIAEPSFGPIPAVIPQDHCNGGGMQSWRRFSWLRDRGSFSNGTYSIRLDLDNNYNESIELRLTAIGCCEVDDFLRHYNYWFNCNITRNDIDREFCDCWIDQRTSPIIHIGDPAAKNIKVDTSGNIYCNRVEIRPEVNNIHFLPNGTIICKKLIQGA